MVEGIYLEASGGLYLSSNVPHPYAINACIHTCIINFGAAWLLL